MNAIKTVGFRSDDAKTVGLAVGLSENGRMDINRQTIEAMTVFLNVVQESQELLSALRHLMRGENKIEE